MPKIAHSPKTANINIRMLPEVKEEAERVFKYHGLTLPEAITVFVTHACHAGGFPFELKRAPYTDSVSLAALAEAVQLENDPNAKTFKTMEDLIADLESDDDD
ncbi:MAG: type II toxin-antitoxin system RelB/DinJ family antitoxin [Defluviitaleaceae bacterium]|nr:type II toxin-antitoxin system RelB/DinJ family antitoxin [Defluviitaleaceae bacterium]